MELYSATLLAFVQHLLFNWRPTVVVVVSFLNRSQTGDILQTVVDASQESGQPHSRVTFVDLHLDSFHKTVQCYGNVRTEAVRGCVNVPDYVLGANRPSQLVYIHLLGPVVTSNDK